MKKFINKFSIKVLILICIIFTIYYLYVTNIKDNLIDKRNFNYNEDGTVTLGPGMVANGFYDILTHKIIDNGSLYKIENGKLYGTVSFRQNIEEKRNYMLIIMIDYIQHDFIVKNKNISSYSFSLQGEDEKLINIEIENLDENNHEFSYFIIPEPDIDNLSINNESEWNKLLMTSNIYWWRLLFNSNTIIDKTKFDNSYFEMDSQIMYGMQLTKKHQKVAAMPKCISMEDTELVLSNINNYDMEYCCHPLSLTFV